MQDFYHQQYYRPLHGGWGARGQEEGLAQCKVRAVRVAVGFGHGLDTEALTKGILGGWGAVRPGGGGKTNCEGFTRRG